MNRIILCLGWLLISSWYAYSSREYSFPSQPNPLTGGATEGVNIKQFQTQSELHETSLVAPLLAIFKQAVEDENSTLSDEAANALSRLKDPQSIGVLILALNSEDGDARMVVAWALGEIGNKRAIVPLEHLLKVETRKYVRFVVETALKKLK